MTSSAIVPSNNMLTSFSMSICRKVPGMSVTATYLPSFASTAQDIFIASSDTVGELVSDFVVYSLCDHPSSQLLAFMIPSCFSFRNIDNVVLFFPHMTYLHSSWAIVHPIDVVDLIL